MMQIDPMLQAVRQAAALCQEVQRGTLLGIDKFSPEKAGSEPVTIADYGSQAILCRALQQHFPDDGVIAEEAGSQFLELTNDQQKTMILDLIAKILGIPVSLEEVVNWLDHGKDKQAKRVWVIDPIDGTKGFIALRHYSIGVGIVEGGKPTGSIIGVPGAMNQDGLAVSGKLFYIRDGVPYSEPMAGGEAQAIHVTDHIENLHIVQSFERQHASKERMAALREKAGMGDARITEIDSMEKYAMVASGQADVYMRLPNLDNTRPHMSWDHAAGVALVLAAGGQCTDIDGKELDFSKGKILPNRGMLISNGKVQQALITAAMAVLEEESNG
jgi:3'(2'), 5'-bisphosphate nucleotidase